MIGQRFARLTVIEGPFRLSGRPHCKCRCDCGAEITTRATKLRSGHTRSCGCFKIDALVQRRATHRQSSTPMYRIWAGMLTRCFNPNDKNYRHYGGRGITVCDKWRYDFPAFLADVGQRPTPKHTIDRIDNDRGYEPGNVRWATRREQLFNTRRSLAKRAREQAQP